MSRFIGTGVGISDPDVIPYSLPEGYRFIFFSKTNIMENNSELFRLGIYHALISDYTTNKRYAPVGLCRMIMQILGARLGYKAEYSYRDCPVFTGEVNKKVTDAIRGYQTDPHEKQMRFYPELRTSADVLHQIGEPVFVSSGYWTGTAEAGLKLRHRIVMGAIDILKEKMGADFCRVVVLNRDITKKDCSWLTRDYARGEAFYAVKNVDLWLTEEKHIAVTKNVHDIGITAIPANALYSLTY